jgi:hypothetical protein
MASKNQVTLTFAGDSKQLERTIDRVGDSTDRMTRHVGQANRSVQVSADGLGSSLLKVGAATTAVVAAGATAVMAVGRLGTEIFSLSRTMVDLDRKSAAVFEDQLPTINAWAEANRKAFGTSTREVVGLASNMADLLKPMGFTARQATDMTTKTLDLAGALAKWSGGTRTAAEVSDILTKAMLGERDMLKGLGISISEADVKARLLAKGQEHLTGVAEQQAVAIATQELIFEKSTDAQKAWADGGQAAAEKQGALSSAIDTLKEKVAKLLTPAFEAATTTVGTWADTLLAKFDEVAPKVQSFTDKELSGMKTSLIDLKDNVLDGVKNGFDDIKVSVDANADSWRTLSGAIAASVKVAGPVLKWMVETVAIGVGAALDWVARLINALQFAWEWIGRITGLWDNRQIQHGPTFNDGQGQRPGLQKFHDGGVVPGAPGSEMLAVLQAGETVTPAGQSGSVVLEVRSSGNPLDDLIAEIVTRVVKARGGDVQLAFGAGR